MRYEPLPPTLFVEHRRRFVRELQPDALAIFHANDRMPRNGDNFFPFRQNSNLFYLSGLDQEEVVVVLFPNCPKEGFEEIAFIRRPTAHAATWDGPGYTREQARAISGMQKVFWLEDMPPILHELMLLARRVYLDLDEHDRQLSPVETRNQREARALMDRYPVHKYHRVGPTLKKLAMVKSPIEQGVLRHACAITGEAFRQVLPRIRPGWYEYQVEAELTAALLRQRATGHAYPPIVASGQNNCILHYHANSGPCRHGDILLLDFGAEYANYAADLTRCIPVSGTFTDRQREVYQAVLRVLRQASPLLVPGRTLDEFQQDVGRLMEEELLRLGLLAKSDIRRQSGQRPAYKRYFMHRAAHHVGLDVHDRAQRYDPLQAGMVLACEPGIYLPEEQLGIRLENVYLVTDHGPVDLMEQVPIEMEEIEELMRAPVLNGP